MSAIQAFDPHTYAGCNRRWYFEAVLGMRPPESRGQKIGQEGHGQIEHYLKTGADVLQPFARAGKHLLPRPGSDLYVEGGFATEQSTQAAIALCAKDPPSPARDIEVTRLAGLAAAGIPLVGYIDVRHRRGEYVDADGTLRKEDSPDKTAEVIDHKFSADINTYGKSADEVAETVQMTGYTVHVSNVEPNIEVVRNSHIYYQTRGAKTARKITSLVVVDDARRRWERVDGVVRSMIDVAKATDVRHVEPHTPSCDAYRGCPHRQYCPDLPVGTVFDLLQIPEGARMSGKGLFEGVPLFSQDGATITNSPIADLFADVPPLPVIAGGSPPVRSLFDLDATTAPPVPIAPLTPAEHAALRAAEIARLSAEQDVPCQKCGAQLCPENTAALPGGGLRHVGCPGLHFGTVNPPGSIPPGLLEVAQPVDSGALAAVDDPVIRARAQALEEEAARLAAAQASQEGKKVGGRCPSSNQTVAITPKEASTKKKLCTCGKELRIKPSEDYTEAVLPSHNIPKAETAVPPLPGAVPSLPGAVPPLPGAAPPLPTGQSPSLEEHLLQDDLAPHPIDESVLHESCERFLADMRVARDVAARLLGELGSNRLSPAEYLDTIFKVYDRIRAR